MPSKAYPARSSCRCRDWQRHRTNRTGQPSQSTQHRCCRATIRYDCDQITAISFLLVRAAAANLAILLGVWCSFRRFQRTSVLGEGALDLLLAGRGLFARLFHALFRAIPEVGTWAAPKCWRCWVSGDQLALTGPSWDEVSSPNDSFGSLGFALVGIFVRCRTAV